MLDVRAFRYVAVAITASVLIACSRSPDNTDITTAVAPTSIVPLDKSVVSVAWIDAGLFATIELPEAEIPDAPTRYAPSYQLVRIDPASGRSQPVAITGSSCQRLDPILAQATFDNRLLLNSQCFDDDPLSKQLDVFDPSTGITTTLVADLDGLGLTSWNFKNNEGVTDLDSLLCASIEWITPEGPLVRDVIVGEGDRRWSLALYFERHAQNQALLVDDSWSSDEYLDCDAPDAGGLAQNPALSPDGTKIAFFISGEAIGKVGGARSGAEKELWVMGPEGQDPHRYMGGWYQSGGTTWSPSGRCLALVGERGRERGIWLLNFRENKLEHVSEFEAQTVTWSPDGSTIAASRDLDVLNDPPPTEVRTVDVSSSLGGYCKGRSDATPGAPASVAT